MTKSLELLRRCIYYLHTHPFNGPFSGTTRVSGYQIGKTSLDFTEARDIEWQWHQLGHMQICSSLQTDITTPAPHHSKFLRAGCTSCRPTNSVEALNIVYCILFNYNKNLIHTPRSDRFAGACPRDTVNCEGSIRALNSGEFEPRCTAERRNLGPAGHSPRLNLQPFSGIVGHGRRGTAEKRPGSRLPVDRCRYLSRRRAKDMCSCTVVVGHDAGQGHVVTLNDRSGTGDAARRRRI